MANMGSRRPSYQQAQGEGAGWMLFCVCIAIALALAALPWIILGLVAQRLLSRWFHWRLSFLIWFVLLFAGAFALYTSYQHGLEALWQRELTDYIIAAKHAQYDLASYPLRQLWADTWPVWLHSWQSLGIAGFVGELYANRNDTVRTLRDNERRRERRAQQFGHRARKRTSHPERLPDAAKGMMVMGVPIKRDEGA
jgi:hypothetical protein